MFKEVNPGRIDDIQTSNQVKDVKETEAKPEPMEVDPPSQIAVKEITIFPPNKPMMNLLPISGLLMGVISNQRVRVSETYELMPIVASSRVTSPIITAPMPIMSTFCSQKRKLKPRSNHQQRHIRVREDEMLVQSYLKKDGTLVEYVKGPDNWKSKEDTQAKES